MGFISGTPFVPSIALDLPMVLNENAILEDSDGGRFYYFVAVKFGGVEDYVVALPLSRGAAGVDDGRFLAVDGSGLPIGVGFIVVGIEYLDFVFAHQEDAAVAATLTSTGDFFRGYPLDMKLTTAEMPLGHYIAGILDRQHGIAFDPPFGGAAGFGVSPFGKARAVKEDYRVTGRLCGWIARSYDPRRRAVGVVYGPFVLHFVLCAAGEKESDQQNRKDTNTIFHGMLLFYYPVIRENPFARKGFYTIKSSDSKEVCFEKEPDRHEQGGR